MDERGSVDKLVGVSGRVVYDRFGVELANNLASTTRTRFVSPAFLRLGTSERLSLAPSGIYLPTVGRLTVSAMSAPLGIFLAPTPASAPLQQKPPKVTVFWMRMPDGRIVAIDWERAGTWVRLPSPSSPRRESGGS